ncbi:DsbA family protein [Candidatus Gottesmanbacteria bacterium]|nr:DsbA family protein [Candidatus Gottesmanbacteria bacterium]
MSVNHPLAKNILISYYLWMAKQLSSFKFSLPKFSFQQSGINGFLVLSLIIFAFALGMLTNKVIYLEQQSKNPTTSPAAPAPAQAQAAAPNPSANIEDIKKLFDGKNIVFGNKNSKNLIVEFADPSCPYCHVAGGKNSDLNKQMGGQFTLEADGGTYIAPVPKIKELVDQGKAAFVWVYFPGHGNGEMGTKALYCAYEQGKFWEVHDKLMSSSGYDVLNNQVKNDTTKAQVLTDFLADVADAGQMKACLDNDKYTSKLSEDINIAKKFSVNGTPGFFINTTPFTGAYSWKDMASAIK